VEICKKFSRKCGVFFIIWRFPFPDAAIALFHNIAQTKKGILLLLLCIMATLIESEDNMDDVYIPSFDMFLAAKPARMKLLLKPTSGKRNYCNCCSGK
jgi:hypothetical protein